MSRVREVVAFKGMFMGGLAFYPYQWALGFSLRYWPCLFAPSFRLHIGPFKVWGGVRLKEGDG